MSHRSRHSEALFGIHLAESSARARGEPPGEEELALLLEGKLSEPRRGEVLSHLAADPGLYRQWQTLCELHDQSRQAQTSSLWQVLAQGLNNWLVDWRYAAGGIGAMAAVLLLINTTTLPPEEQAAVESLARAPAAKEKMLEKQAPAADMEREQPPSEPAPSADVAAPSQRMMAQPEAGESSAGSSMADDATAYDSQAGAALQEERIREETFARRQNAPQQKSEAAIARQTCVEMNHPQNNSIGALCAVLFESGEQRWVWQARDAGEQTNLMRSEQRALRFRLSPDQQWLAYQTPAHIFVLGIDDLFTRKPQQRQLPFDAATASFQWEGSTLVVSVMQALGDSDDDLIYRYDPVSGALSPPPQPSP